MLMRPTPHPMSRPVVVVCVPVGLVAHATAQQPTPQAVLPDVQKLGPQVGTRVPDFSLLDQKGQSRTLSGNAPFRSTRLKRSPRTSGRMMPGRLGNFDGRPAEMLADSSSDRATCSTI
jgi:hypothetical protein